LLQDITLAGNLLYWYVLMFDKEFQDKFPRVAALLKTVYTHETTATVNQVRGRAWVLGAQMIHSVSCQWQQRAAKCRSIMLSSRSGVLLYSGCKNSQNHNAIAA
jgi:hypothetical protein